MSINNYKNFFKEISQKVRDLDLNSLSEKIRNFQIKDLSDKDYKRLFYYLRTSKYSKPISGLLGASLLSVFVLIPKIEYLISSFKRIELYENESKQLSEKSAQLKKANEKFKEISQLMSDVNTSIFKKERTIFISRLLNNAAKKTNINISSFTPIIKADSSNLCKTSLSQKNSKKFKTKKSKKFSTKGDIQNQFFEVNFNSNYMDIFAFLKEIQIYDMVVITHCLEVDSEQKKSLKKLNENSDNVSILLPLNESGIPVETYMELAEFDNSQNIGNVSTRIILKIPTYQK